MEKITFLYIYAPNIGSPKYIRKMLTDLNREISNTGIGDFSTPLQQLNIQTENL